MGVAYTQVRCLVYHVWRHRKDVVVRRRTDPITKRRINEKPKETITKIK